MTSVTALRPTALRPKAAAAYVGLSESSLARMRFRGEGPRFTKPGGGRLVYYLVADLDAWMAGEVRETRPTAANE